MRMRITVELSRHRKAAAPVTAAAAPSAPHVDAKAQAVTALRPAYDFECPTLVGFCRNPEEAPRG